MEIAGESLGMDCDKTIHRYFRDHWRHLFPNLGTRTTFLRQAANLWRVKQEIRRILLTRLLPTGSRISIVDGFPMPVCGFRRAHFSKLFKGEATYGYCAAKAMTYYGLKGHLLIDLSGIIVDCTVFQQISMNVRCFWKCILSLVQLCLAIKDIFAIRQ